MLQDIFSTFWQLIISEPTRGIGVLISVVCLFVMISELWTKIKYSTTSENLVLGIIGFIFGIVLIFFADWVMAVALSLFVLAAFQTYQLRESPVWRELMITSVVTYFVFLVGTIGSQIFGDERIMGWAYNLMIYVFLIMALLFFGKKFVLVSRFMSPQILYLSLFVLVYILLYTVTNLLPSFENLAWYYLPIDRAIADRVIFLSFGTYESIIILAFGLYFVSGGMLTKLLGIKPLNDPHIEQIVEEVRIKLGIKRKIKIGFVKAPILNAMAYGPFFDQRVAFVSKDMESFSDDDIRGIVAHELAHNARYHIIWLQFLASLEMIIKKALLLPATTLDYAAYEQKVSFALYFLINYGLAAFLFIFVRILEGDADLQTKKAGYGKQLAQVLYKLEGFYQGIAGDFGVNVQLLTGKEFTEDERQRFLGEAASRLYSQIYKPGRWAMFSNVFMSHPRTVFRILAMLSKDLSPLKSALLPYWLIMPNFLRGKTIKNMSIKRDAFDEMISEKYLEYYGDNGVSSFLSIIRSKDLYTPLIGSDVVIYDPIYEEAAEGHVIDLKESTSICRPLLLVLGTKEGEKEFLISDYDINVTKKNELYVLKDGTIGKLLDWKYDPKSSHPLFRFQINENNKNVVIEREYTGKILQYFDSFVDKSLFVYSNGIDQAYQLKELDIKNTLKDSIFKLNKIDNPENGELVLTGAQLIIELPPVLLRITKNKETIQKGLFDLIVGKSVILFTKEEIEVGIACVIKSLTPESITYKIKEQETTIAKKKIDYIQVFSTTPKLFVKNHVSVLDRVLIWWSNRKEMKYIR